MTDVLADIGLGSSDMMEELRLTLEDEFRISVPKEAPETLAKVSDVAATVWDRGRCWWFQVTCRDDLTRR